MIPYRIGNAIRSIKNSFFVALNGVVDSLPKSEMMIIVTMNW